MTKIRIAGLDGSKKNFGIAVMELDLATMAMSVIDLVLVKTEKSQSKTVRQSSDNLRRAQEQASAIPVALKGCISAFLEVPSGGQDYHSVLAFGTTIGIYACIEGMLAIPTIEVSPSETKMAAMGTKTASKQEMIEWAVDKYPNAPWRTARGKVGGKPTLDNEHLADAIAIAEAGIKTPAFRQTMAILAASMPKAA